MLAGGDSAELGGSAFVGRPYEERRDLSPGSAAMDGVFFRDRPVRPGGRSRTAPERVIVSSCPSNPLPPHLAPAGLYSPRRPLGCRQNPPDQEGARTTLNLSTSSRLLLGLVRSFQFRHCLACSEGSNFDVPGLQRTHQTPSIQMQLNEIHSVRPSLDRLP